MTREQFAKLKHRIVGITGEYDPENVFHVNNLLSEVEIKIPTKCNHIIDEPKAFEGQIVCGKCGKKLQYKYENMEKSNEVIIKCDLVLDKEQVDKFADFLAWLKNDRLLKKHGHEAKEFEL